MTPLLLACVGLLTIGEFLLFGALAEAYRDIAQLRELSGMTDRLMPADLGEAYAGRPSEYGLDETLDHIHDGLALFVDTRCGTCRAIVESMKGAVPSGVSMMIMARSPEDAIEWLQARGFDLVAADGRIRILQDDDPNPLNVHVTPLAVRIEDGRIARADNIPSVRRFHGLVESLSSARNDVVKREVLA